MKAKTIDFTPYQTGRLNEADQRILAALVEAGYELRRIGLICERSGQYWLSKRTIVCSASQM